MLDQGKLHLGDTVQHKTGGPRLTVVSLGTNKVAVQWEATNGIQLDVFPYTSVNAYAFREGV